MAYVMTYVMTYVMAYVTSLHDAFCLLLLIHVFLSELYRMAGKNKIDNQHRNQ